MKQKDDDLTRDWVDEADERRYKEEQEHARRIARQDKYERKAEQASTKDRPKSKARSKN